MPRWTKTPDEDADKVQAEAEDATPEKKPEPKIEAREVVFVSRDAEPFTFDLLIGGKRIRGRRPHNQERVFWDVPVELVERVEKHAFFLSGRIHKVR